MHTVSVSIQNLDHDAPADSVAAFWGVIAVDRIPLSYDVVDDHTGARTSVEFTPPDPSRVADVLARAEAFVAGFEDDEMQEGIPELLRDLRAVQGKEG